MRVFISHAAADQDLARTLASELEAAGFEIWRPSDVLPGGNWAAEMGHALETSEVLVVLLTRRAFGSANVIREVQFGLTSGSFHGRVVPVVVDADSAVEAEPEFPWVLLKLDPIQVTSASPDWQAVVRKVEAVSRAGCDAAP